MIVEVERRQLKKINYREGRNRWVEEVESKKWNTGERRDEWKG